VRPHRALAGIVLLLLGLAAPVRGDAQSWRESALASFDEAWQTINDTYPDPSFGGLDWAALKDDLRPRVERAASADDARGVIREMLGRLGQSHFALLSSTGGRARGEARVAVDVRLLGTDVVIIDVVPDSAAAKAGLHPGQIITRVDDEPSGDWLAAAQGLNERGRAADAIAHALTALSGPAGSKAAVVVKDAAGERSIAVPRERENGRVVRFGNLPPLVVDVEAAERRTPNGHRAGVIAFNVWMPAATTGIDAAVDRFREADGLVLDLRGNPGGLVEMIRGVAGHVFDEPLSLGRLQTRQAQLLLEANPRFSTTDGRSVRPYSGPVAVLVDELTASASECFAGGLQSLGRARIFGRTTMGQALPAATHRLPNGDVLMHVLGDFVTPDGTRLEGRGVIPDEIVPLSLDGLRSGTDAVLDAALAWIDRNVTGF